MYQQKPVIIVTMASGIATIRVARAVSSVSAPNAMVSGSDETDHGSSGELDAVISVVTDTDPRP